MGDLALDTRLDPLGSGVYERVLSRDWEIWGPNGGYMSALALRAAADHSGRSRPANATVHFLGVASFDEPVTITARTQRATRQGHSIAVEISQAGKPVLAAMIWAFDDGMEGRDHDDAPMPDIPRWRDCPTMGERFAAAGVPNPTIYRFWDNFEQRPVGWIDDWENRVPTRALYQEWLRFVDGGAPADPWDQAARLLLLVDLGGYPALGRRYVGPGWMAPTIDVSCEFHRPATADEWFLLQGESPFSGDGLVGTHQHVWNDRGELLASGISHLLWRRIG